MTASHVAALGRVAHLLAETEDTAGTVRAVAEEGMRVLGANRAAVFLLDDRDMTVHGVLRLGVSEAYVEAVQQHAHQAHWSRMVLAGEARFVRDAREDTGNPVHAAIQAEGFVGVAALPLTYGGGVIGWLAFYHDQPRDYSASDRVLALAFADQAALAIGMRRLLDTVVRVKNEWQSAFDGTGNGLALVNGDGTIDRANRFVASLAGVNVTELPGVALSSLFLDWPSGGQDPLTLSRARGYRVSLFLDTPSGQHLAVTATPRSDGGFVVALDDLTQYVRLESRYTRLVETAHDAIILAGSDGRVLSANPAAAELFGVPEPALAGQSLDLLLPDDTIRGTPDPGASRRYRSLIRRPDGMRIAEVSRASLEERGTPAGTVAVARDVTRERLAAEALRRSERRFRALFNRAPLAIFTLDPNGRFLSANRAALRLAGLVTPRPGPRLADFVLKADWPSLQEELGRSYRGETRDFGFRFARSDGVIRQASAVAVPVDERGGARAVLAIARDVTDEVELRERLNHSEKMAALGGLVSGVAHELNNPLAGIAAMAQALQFEGGTSSDVAQGLDTMRREAMRAARIVNDLLTFARLRPIERQETDLNVIVRDTFAATPALAEHGVVWTLGLDPTLPTVTGDPDQVRQVVTNLLVNAAQAMETMPRRDATVRTWWDAGWAGFEVLDSGPGIPAEALSRVFEPFFTTKAQGQGTGLGLSISHGIIRAHGGEIHGENRPEGGARFAFRLPRDLTRISRTRDA
ncbi:MAG TPA: PAS domain S-box protein [Gemmatimonadales bacterium]|nr:PAS domain S-box protein [Gemmatimonadales bacterium]